MFLLLSRIGCFIRYVLCKLCRMVYTVAFLQVGNAGEPATNGATGRASHRGGARGEARVGAGAVDMPTSQLAQMSIGTGDAASQRPRREISYNEPNTRPSRITDKRGMS